MLNDGQSGAPATPEPDPATVDRLPVPWVELDGDGRILWHNPRFATLSGRDASAPLTGERFSALLAPASQVYFDLGVLPPMQMGQEMREVHLMLKLVSAEELPVLCSGMPLPGRRISLVVLPIAERRRLENELVSVRNAVEQVPGAVFQLTQSTCGRLRCVYFSGDALTLLGVARPHLHRMLWKMMSRETRRAFARAVAVAAASFSLLRFDIPIPDRSGRPDGTPRWLHIQARAQLQPGGHRLWFGHIMDVSQLKRAESALQASEQRYRSLAEASPIGIFHADRNGRCLFANAGWREIFALQNAAEEWLELIAEPERTRLRAALCEREQPAASFELEFHVSTGSATPRHVRLNARRLRTAGGLFDGYVGTVEDITERRAMERALAENHELLRITLQSIGDAVITTDTDGRVRWFNPVAERMSGWSTSEAFGRPLDEVLHILDASGTGTGPNAHLAALPAGTPPVASGDRLLMSYSGGDIRFLTIQQSVAPIRSAGGEVLGNVVVFHDVTEQRAQEEKIRQQAAHDELTGLYNLREFKRRLDNLLLQPLVTGTGHTLLFIDLDRFKLINDALGHWAGDEALRQAVDEIKSALRDQGRDNERDSLLARIGGDEFAIILYNCGQADAESVGNRICGRMENFRFVSEGGRSFRLGASIGLVETDHRVTDATTLLQYADAACYAAKEAGRNRVQAWLDSDRVQTRRTEEMKRAAQLEEAIESGRLELYAQRIEPARGSARGLHCELLLRVRETDGSVSSAGPYMVAAERFQMATRVDRWVVEQALRVLAGPEARAVRLEVVSINVSGHSIADPTFRRDLTRQLRAAAPQVDLSCLCFEITETVLAKNFADAESFVRELHTLGARVAVDDFGAEQAWIAQLKQLPLDHIDYLKIDGAFVRDNFTDPLDTVIVRFFQELATTIGARTVAEWVQTEEARTQLADMGVDYVQGFLVHQPEPFADLLQRCAERQPQLQDRA